MRPSCPVLHFSCTLALCAILSRDVLRVISVVLTLVKAHSEHVLQPGGGVDHVSTPLSGCRRFGDRPSSTPWRRGRAVLQSKGAGQTHCTSPSGRPASMYTDFSPCKHQKCSCQDFPGRQWLRFRAPNAGSLCSIPGQGIRSHR